MPTIQEKLQAAREKREALVTAEAELKAREAEKATEKRKAELQAVLEAALPKVERFRKLRTRLEKLLEESDRITSEEVAPAWRELQKSVKDAKLALETACEQHELPKPNYAGGCKEIEAVASWVPLPKHEVEDHETGEICHITHPAYLSFGHAFMAVWSRKEK